MYRSAGIRIGVLLAVGAAAALSPGYAGWRFGIDAWLHAGLRDLVTDHVALLPLAVWAVAAVADLAGAWLPATAVPVRRPLRWALAVGAGGGAALWLLRVRHWYGDLGDVDRQPLPWWTIEAAEPLGAFTQYHLQHAAAALGIPASTATAAAVTLLGATAIAAMFLWARAVADEWPLVFAMLASSGFMVLFCGYPEKGTPKALALVCWYVYATTRALHARRAAWGALSAGLLSVAGLLHGSALCWLPAHAWFVWRRQWWRGTLAGIAAFTVPIALTLWYARSGAPIAGGPWGNIAAPWQWFKAYCITNCGYDFWSLRHGLDVLNCLLVLGPVALLCWPEALARSRNPTAGWLAAGAAGCVFVSIAWFPVFGYLSDWDIFALAPLALSYHAAFVAVTVMPPRGFRRLALAWIAAAALHTASWWRLFQVRL